MNSPPGNVEVGAAQPDSNRRQHDVELGSETRPRNFEVLNA